MSVEADQSPPRPTGVEQNFPLQRLTTVRTGGPGEYFARAGSREQLLELLAWAAGGSDRGERGRLGLEPAGRRRGGRGLVLKLDRELAAIAVAGAADPCGGGARLPAVAAAAARAGLSGIEFGVNIPGTLGGAVRMNANAYGGELARALEWVEIATARRPTSGALPMSSASPTAARTSSRARSSRALRCCLCRRGSGAGQGDAGRDAPPPPRGPAAGHQDFRLDLQEPRGSARAGAQRGALLAEAGCNGLAVGGARFAPKHANFIENTGAASTAEVIAVMAEGRRRVLERFGVELEPEVQTLGAVRFPWALRR